MHPYVVIGPDNGRCHHPTVTKLGFGLTLREPCNQPKEAHDVGPVTDG